MILLLAVAIPAAAAPTPAAEKAEDFSKAFELLVAAGMPAISKDAKWVEMRSAPQNNYQLSELTASMKGRAWLLKSADGKSRIVPLGMLSGHEIQADAGEGKSGNLLGRMLGLSGEGEKSAEKSIDVDKDVAGLIGVIEKILEGQKGQDDFGFMSDSARFGELLIFAAQLHQTGRSDLGNRLAAVCFKLHKSRESAIDAAVNLIAEHYYQKATQSFFQSGDWSAYRLALTDLLKRYPRGWDARDAVRLVLKGVERRASGEAHPLPSLPGQKINPKALECIAQLSDLKPPKPEASPEMSPEMLYAMQMSGHDPNSLSQLFAQHGLWLLGKAPVADEADEDENCITRLLAMKMEALPALAALVDDSWPTHLSMASSNSGYSSRHSSQRELAVQAYMRMQRPATRGEIARMLLVATLPGALGDLNDASTEALRDAALTFWKAHKEDSLGRLAEVFVQEGSESQSQQVLLLLAASDESSAQKLFEQQVLGSDKGLAYFEVVKSYLRKRRAAAQPFLEAYSKRLREQVGDGDDSDRMNQSWLLENSGGLDKLIKQLESLVVMKSPQKLAMQIAAGTLEDAENDIQGLLVLLEEEPPAKKLEVILNGAKAATDAGVRGCFLNVVPRMLWVRGEGPADSEDRMVSEAEAAIWKSLIDDDRESTERASDDEDEEDGEKVSVGEQAAMMLELSISQSNYYQIYQVQPIIDRPLIKIFHERAKTRLAGGVLPALPDASKVDKDRLAAIVAKAGSMKALEIHPYLKTLTPDERAAWLEWVQNPDELAMPESVKSLRYQIVENTKVNFGGLVDATGKTGMNLGFELSYEALHKIAQNMASDLPKYSGTMASLGSCRFGPGLAVSEMMLPPPAPKSEGDAGVDGGRNLWAERSFSPSLYMLRDADADGLILVMLNLENEQSMAAWHVKKGKLVDVPTESNPYMRQMGALEEGFKQMKDESAPQRFQITLSVLSKADADKINLSSGE